MHDGKQEYASSMLGKFIILKDVNFWNYKLTILHMWGCNEFFVERLRWNVDQLFILDGELRTEILKKCAQCYDNTLLILKPWSRKLNKYDDSFVISGCRPQDYYCYIMDVTRKLGSLFYGCHELETREHRMPKLRFF